MEKNLGTPSTPSPPKKSRVWVYKIEKKKKTDLVVVWVLNIGYDFLRVEGDV